MVLVNLSWKRQSQNLVHCTWTVGGDVAPSGTFMLEADRSLLFWYM